MKNVDEWSGFSELMSNLIAKYADVLDIDSMPDPKSTSQDTKTNEINHTNFDKVVAAKDAA